MVKVDQNGYAKHEQSEQYTNSQSGYQSRFTTAARLADQESQEGEEPRTDGQCFLSVLIQFVCTAC
ncbi:MAG: hypothetical protein JWL79_2127 [Frankiales bacterium]|nr:hypothetical protein [Frankiales bacterium]